MRTLNDKQIKYVVGGRLVNHQKLQLAAGLLVCPLCIGFVYSRA